MAAAACAAAAAVQRAQIFIHAKNQQKDQEQEKRILDISELEEDISESDNPDESKNTLNGETADVERPPSSPASSSAILTSSAAAEAEVSESANNEQPMAGEEVELGGGDGAAQPAQEDLCKNPPSSYDEAADDGDLGDDGNASYGGGSAAGEGALTTSQEVKFSSLVECSSSAPDVLNCENQKINLNQKQFNLKELLHGKLALAAAAHQAHSRQQQQQQQVLTRTPGCSSMMEQTLAAARDFARHNNNELKSENGNKEANAANFMSQLLKMRQEMALNMSLQQQATDKEIRQNREANSDAEAPSPIGKDDIIDDEDDILEEEEEEEMLPIDLQRGSGEDGSVQTGSPRSPSSDAGMSTSSAGKADKASRLEHIVSSMQRASPSLPQDSIKDLVQAANPIPVNGCKKRKLYQPIQAKSGTGSGEEVDAVPDVKKSRDNDENADPTKAPPHPTPPSVGGAPPSVVQMHYMEMARKFLQDQQDKATKEAITKEILSETVGKNNDIADKLVSINPELKGLADLLKSEITASLAIIIDSIVGRFLQATRSNNAGNGSGRPPLAGMKLAPPAFLGLDDLPHSSILPPMPSLKTSSMSGKQTLEFFILCTWCY
jgi:hypothetical protein